MMHMTATAMYMKSHSCSMGRPPLEVRLATSSGSMSTSSAVNVSPNTMAIFGAYAVLLSSSLWK